MVEMKITINYPPNSSFLSETLYEGILYLILNSYVKNFNYNRLELENVEKAIANLEDETIGKIKIRMTGNDNVNSKLFSLFGLNVRSKKTYSDLLMKLKEQAFKAKLREKVNIEARIAKSVMLIDVESEKEGLALPQIFKIDRYTGISSLETPYTSQQVKCRVSGEVALILILGLYSSFTARVIQGGMGKRERKEAYFFLTFAPEEIVRTLMSKSIDELKKSVKTMFAIRDLAKQVIEDVVSKTALNEALAVELALNMKIREALVEHNLDKISFILFKIIPEGQVFRIFSYKIYEQTPITIYRSPPYIRTLGRFFTDPDSIAGRIAEELTSKGAIMRTLGNPEADEHEDVVEAIIGLYRFVVLGDANGWYIFIRKLMDAHNKVKDKTVAYAKILSKLAY